jgi:hypothetical protein
MTKTAPQTSSKAKRESIFRDFMTLTAGKGFSVEIATAAIAEERGTTVEVVTDSLNRTLIGR